MRSFDQLEACFVDGDAKSQRQRRKRRSAALLLASFLELSVLAGAVVVPLYAGSSLFPLPPAKPIPPYRRVPLIKAEPDPAPEQQPRNQVSPIRRNWPIYQPTSIPPTVVAGIDEPPQPAEIGNDTIPCPGCREEGILPNTFSNLDAIGVVPPMRQSNHAKAKSHTKRVIETSKVMEARLVRRILPRYPPLAIPLRLEGTVELRALILRDGTIGQLEVLSGHPLLVKAAVEAVLDWRYQPTLLNGAPVEVETHITVQFRLSR